MTNREQLREDFHAETGCSAPYDTEEYTEWLEDRDEAIQEKIGFMQSQIENALISTAMAKKLMNEMEREYKKLIGVGQ